MPDLSAPWNGRPLVRQEWQDTGPRSIPPTRCVNGRHDGHTARMGAACDRPLPRPPLPHRVAGALAVGAVMTFGVAFTLGWKAGEWLATEGPVYVRYARAAWGQRESAR